jgi:hypothetical protein
VIRLKIGRSAVRPRPWPPPEPTTNRLLTSTDAIRGRSCDSGDVRLRPVPSGPLPQMRPQVPSADPPKMYGERRVGAIARIRLVTHSPVPPS